MLDDPKLEPADVLAARSPIRQLGESDDYRAARQRLLVREYELRRMIESVAVERRALPLGAVVRPDYRFTGEAGEVTLAELFGDHDALFVYSYMFGPQRAAPCPMCTGLMQSMALRIPAIVENIAIAFTARSPIARLVEAKRDLGMPDLPVYSDDTGDYTRDWVHPDDADMPGLSVFRRDGDLIRHFWSAETTEADPGQDPRSAPEVDALWSVLDMAPTGRQPDWYPSLNWAGRR